METEKLKQFDPELLLQELRAREGSQVREKDLEDTFPCGRFPSMKAAIGGGIEPVPDLDEFHTEDIVKALREQQKVLYGNDDRDEMHKVTDRAIRTDADSVVALIDAGDIVDNGDGTSALNGRIFGTQYSLCQSEPFRDQPSIAFCSGFLVDPSIVATAAHCVESDNLDSVRFVFGFEMMDAGTANTTIRNEEIYRGIRILGRQIGIQGTDWALVQLDRPVLNHPYVRIRRRDKIEDGAAVHVIGHPSGLPKKYAGNAEVRDNSPLRYFVANTDTYGGNSGSAVFNSSTHVVEGILVRGETDFAWNGNCRVSNVCPANGCRGEDCTRTTEFETLVPLNRHDFIPFNSDRTAAVQINGRWKIVAGGMGLLDFGNREGEAMQALNVIRHYNLNCQCFVGRPHPSMEFYLVNGESPEGTMEGEDAIGFNPARIQVQYVRGRWKIVAGDSWIMDFNQAEDEARQALSYIIYYGFRHMCFVGRPDPLLTYFRR